MAKKLKVGTIVLIGVGGFAAIVALDHFVLKGKLGIAGRINMLIGQIKKQFGSGAGPITPAPLPEGGLPPQTGGEGTPLEASLMEAEEQLAAEEPETAAIARRRAYRAYKRSGYRANRVRLGGYGY
jgi:hypothetical protein